ncbi:hypothetical protein WJX73_010134 [Symbiochloris irregularis]|uniref:Uncharacterized protein n=1 Tax=Symbiochloris irregularis TaxID=706552 RepID=A0AAW1P830_9CHLO
MSGCDVGPPKLDGLLSRLSQVEALSLAGSDCLDQISLQGLAEIPSLRVLDLRNTALVTDLRALALDTVILKNSRFQSTSPADDALDEDRMGLFVSFYSEHVRSMKSSEKYHVPNNDDVDWNYDD